MKQRVVVVDDSAICRALLCEWLHADGDLEVVGEAPDGDSAIELITRLRPDVATIDLRLPGMSGLEVARAVRADANEAVAATPILACSASVQPEVRREALDAGCDAFEGKPFDIRSFADLLLGLIARRAPG